MTSAADRSMPTPTPPPPFPPHAAAGAGGDVLAASGGASGLGGAQSRLAMAVGPGSCGQSTAARIFHRTELAALEEGGSEATGCGPAGLKDFVGDASAGGGGHTSLPQIDASTISVLTHLRNKLARTSESRCTTASGGGAARHASTGALVVLPPQPVAVAAAAAAAAATAASKKEGTSRLLVELKALQLQVDRLKDGRSGVDGGGGGGGLGATMPGGGLGGTQQQQQLMLSQGSKGGPSSPPSQRTIPRKLIPAQDSSGAAADDGDGSGGDANSTNPLTAAKEIRRKIQRIRCDPNLREELSLQCEAYQRERQAKRSCASPSAAAAATAAAAAAAAGGRSFEAVDTDCVRRNASPRSLAACSEEAKARSLRRRRREREARTADTRRARVQALSTEHARREHQLGKKMLHLAMLKGTLSTKQSQVVTASRMWMPIYFAYVFARRVQDQLEHARIVEAVCVRGKQVGAVRSLERWWQRHSARRELNAYKVALKLARPWRNRAQVRIVKRHYLLIAQFTKDWCASKRVVVAVKRVMTRTKKIQQWFLRIILVRRARKALWLAQWSCCEERARAAHDSLSARALKKHGNRLKSSKPSQLPPPQQLRSPTSPVTPKQPPKVASDDGTAAGVETVHARRASRAARRSVADHRAGRGPLDSSCEVDVSVFKKLTALPCVPEAYRMEAVSAEMLLVTRRHTKRLIAAEKEWAEYRAWEEGAMEQRRQMLAAGLSEAPEDDDNARPMPAPLPRLGALLPQADLHRLIEATTKRFAAAIADRVAGDIGAVSPEQQETLKQAALGHCVFTPAPPSPPSLVGQLQQPPPRRHGRMSHFPVSPQRKPTPTPADSEAAAF